MRTIAHRVATASPSDVSGLATLLDTGALRPEDVVAVLGKTEGNGGRNDFTRELAAGALERLLAERLGATPAEIRERVVLSLSGGCEGVASPHLVVFGRTGAPLRAPGAEKRLASGGGATRAVAPVVIGRRALGELAARAVRAVASTLDLDGPGDVHLVQMKGAIPAASAEATDRARAAGAPLRNDMAGSRAASALGAALAVGEIDDAAIDDAAIGQRLDLWSSVASVSAKPGLARTEILVLGMSRRWEGDLAVAHGVMRDILDVGAVRDVLAALGLGAAAPLAPEEAARIVGVFAKSEADPRGTIRGRRHVMLDDDDVGDTRWSRCTLAAVLASVTGDGAVYVSTRAEHMGPPGGGPVAVVARAR